MRLLPIILVAAAVSLAAGDAQPKDQLDFFESRVRPVLIDACQRCHGGEKTENRLRVDSREALLKGGDNGPAVVPGDPKRSLLVQAVRHEHDDFKMPKKRLSSEDIAAIESWIASGAAWPAETSAAPAQPVQGADHWAFRPVGDPRLPEVADERFRVSPVDRFIGAALAREGLKPQPRADRRTLVRRATFDLTGLPPTPEEIAAFVADERPDAWPRLVDRLLASPAYGERWGRHWLDLARYADTAGNSSDHPIPEARLYRDWVIRAFNDDEPYDRFLAAQLAGDLIARKPDTPAERYRDLVVATGFIAQSRRFGVGRHQDMHLTIEDTIDTLGRAVMGLTLKCARCHHHKFDPVTTEDYYALYGIFRSTRYPFPGSENEKQPEDLVPLLRPGDLASWIERDKPDAGRRAAEARAKSKEAQALAKLDQRIGDLKAKAATDAKAKAELAKAEGERAAKAKDLDAAVAAASKPQPPAAYAVWESDKIADAEIQRRGDPHKKGPAVKRGAIAVLGDAPSIPSDQSGRLQLAQWLTSGRHPLTARVAVNWVWHHHFGRGLVPSLGNFGLRGDAPSHPELLDWLAHRFVADGWSFKKLHRQLLLSETYTMASGGDAANLAKDPGNRWRWRFDRRRLDAEQLRDAMLAASGELEQVARPGDPAATGEHPFPPKPKWGFTQHHPFTAEYETRRRSVYLMVQRFQRHSYLGLFDGPDPNVVTERRRETTVPLQALWMLNSGWVEERAAGLAGRALAVADDDGRRIAWAHELVTGRPPTTAESRACAEFLARWRTASQGRSGGGGGDQAAWTALARVLLAGNGAVFVD